MSPEAVKSLHSRQNVSKLSCGNGQWLSPVDAKVRAERFHSIRSAFMQGSPSADNLGQNVLYSNDETNLLSHHLAPVLFSTLHTILVNSELYSPKMQEEPDELESIKSKN